MSRGLVAVSVERGFERADAERLAVRLAAKEQGCADAVRSLTFGADLTREWLPAKRLHLAASTFRGYERNIKIHIIPTLGRIPIRRLRYQQGRRRCTSRCSTRSASVGSHPSPPT